MPKKKTVNRINELKNIFREKLAETQEKIGQVELIATYILKKDNVVSPEKSISGTRIFQSYQKLPKCWNLPTISQNTFTIYLSRIANDSSSQINTPGRTQGYYIIDELYKEIEDDTFGTRDIESNTLEEEKNQEHKKGNLLERDLYPFLEKWLLAVGNERAHDISNLRTQGKWANPDLVGFKTDDLFGKLEVEITTIEAKITLDAWEQWIFEAVAHTVFANRAYFAFVHAEELLNKIDNELKHYAEIFGVGILVLIVSKEDYIKIKTKEPFELTDDNHKIVEYSPAPFKTPHIKFKKKFLNGIGIFESKEIHTFGTGIEN